jgi:hypothetical protein
MFRPLAIVSSMFALPSRAVAPGGGAPQPVLEIVVFRVNDAAGAEPLRAAAHAQIAGYPGFVRALRLVAVDDPALFGGVVQWRSLADAQAAMARAEKDPVLQPFFGALGPIVSIGHYPLTAAASAGLLDRLAKAPVVEIAAYTVKDRTLQDAAQAGLHAAFASMPVVLGSAPLRALEGGGYVDLIGWQSKEAHAATAAQMEQDPQSAAFIANIGEMKLFSLFTVAGSVAAR